MFPGAPAPEPMRSAYKECVGEEPAFTNYAQSRDAKEPVVATLDYIWMSDRVAARECLPLPSADKVSGPLPNKEEGSDHVPVVAMLEVGVAEPQAGKIRAE